MRHVKILGLCLAAVFAIAAYASASASALPEFGECVAHAGGKYKDPNCNEKAKKGSGTYEWKKGSTLPPRAFEGKNVGSGGVLSTGERVCENTSTESDQGRLTRAACAAKGDKTSASYEALYVECESERNTGEITGPKSISHIGVVFNGCKLLGTVPCSNTPKSGEIQVNPLKGTLGYISKSEHKVGVLLEPERKKGEFAKFTCTGGEAGGLTLTTVVGVGNDKEGAEYTSSGCKGECPGATPNEEKNGGYDGILSPITPVNKSATHFTQVYSVNHATDENIPSRFEGKHIDLLEDYIYSEGAANEGSDWMAAGEEITNENVDCELGEFNRAGFCEHHPGYGEIKA